ncbi:hypothetical protein BsWGS_17883 [Bradybaena similaris]
MGVSECVQYIRENFEKKYAENIASGMYDDRDLKRLQNDSIFASTYIKSQDRLDESVELVHSSLKFRKEIKVNDLSESSFDIELMKLGCAYFHNKDINGHRILWLKVKLHRKDAPTEKIEAEKQGLVFAIEKAFNEAPQQEIVVLLDMTACAMANLDIDFVKYIITIFRQYYPTFLAYMLMYDMPWIFNAAWKMIKSWLNQETVAKIKFVTRADIHTYVKAEDLPPHMGGTDDFEFVYTPGMTNEPLYPEDDVKKDKKVHFQEVQEYSSIPGNLDSLSGSDSDNTKYDINANTSDGLRHRPFGQSQYNKSTNLNNSALDKKQSAVQGHSKSMPHANTFVGRFLKVSPGDELTFLTRGNGDPFDTITLTNTLPVSVAFKVKTTSPEKFRVRPSSGVIKPDKKEEVYVGLIPDQAVDVSKEKFLVMAMEAPNDGVDPNQLFRDAGRGKVMQHKIGCSIGFQESLQARETAATHVLKPVADPLISKIEQLQLQNRCMQRQLNILLGLQILTTLTVLLMILLYSCFGEDLFSHFLALPFEFCHETCGRKC